ncbi:hypothetical protein FNV58_00650 (plasmid) [Streptomyces sp. RLB1-9]|uniref:hypothetical protein n=1 Tax=Streptomyces sp. RLB1-9 TaxID=2594454 RepID=UPI001161EED2|nr:hypothetical protein [Streptomyces sp. RLB1-9]QDN94869.1 hypothetical protein FNV58_00650 [Streptomyces sp. RLB1-9]
MAANSVTGQVAAGTIDGFLRDDQGDGTLGLPDYSLVPYTYSQMLGNETATPQWFIDQYRFARFAGFKGSPDGYGVLRDTGGVRGAASISVIPQSTGTITASPDGTRDPDYTWGPRDFAFSVRHPGTIWQSTSAARTYVALTQGNNTIGVRQTIPGAGNAVGPWDAEKADSAAITLPTAIKPWDGNPHSYTLSTFGQNVFCLIDNCIGFPFRAPRAYKRNANGTTNTAVFSDMSASGSFMGADYRGTDTALYQWDALQAASGEFFLYDMGATAVQAAPATTYTPTTTPSGETWSLSGTVTASKDGILLAANATASFNVDWQYGVLTTRWGTATAEGGLVWRKVDANNYYQMTSTGLYSCIGGTLTKFFTFTTPIAAGDHVAVRNWPGQIRVYVNGVSQTFLLVTTLANGKGVGFRSPSTGTSQWRYIHFQPLVSDPTMPTS